MDIAGFWEVYPLLLPRYFFREDFNHLEDWLLDRCVGIREFKSGSFLNGMGIDYNTIYYILSGVGVFYVIHESGERSTLTYHGYGTMYPLVRLTERFKMEDNIFFQAVTDMKVAVFPDSMILDLMMENRDFARAELQLFEKHINLFIFRTANNEHGDALSAVSNFLYMMLYNKGSFARGNTICLSQDEIAEGCGLTRVHVTRTLKVLAERGVIGVERRKIIIHDLDRLIAHCSKDLIDE